MNEVDFTDYFRAFFALLFVLSLMGGIAVILKRGKFSFQGILSANSKRDKRRLQLTETLHLDAGRKIVLVRKDEHEHLILLGTKGETLLESSLVAKQDSLNEARDQ